LIVLALGSNKSGKWGNPERTVQQAIRRIDALPSIRVISQSSLYRTAGMGPGRPDDFINAVIACISYLPPSALLRSLKQMERLAGNRSAMRWGPRSLDLDIIDYYGLVRGWMALSKKENYHACPGKLVLPHPLMHQRVFVLEPLTECQPKWLHPVFFRTATDILSGIRHNHSGRILEKLG